MNKARVKLIMFGFASGLTIGTIVSMATGPQVPLSIDLLCGAIVAVIVGSIIAVVEFLSGV